MNKGIPKIEYDSLKKNLLNAAAQIPEKNKKFNVDGERLQIPLQGRNIEIIYYSVEQDNAPLLVCFHGGGFLMGACSFDNDMYVSLRKELGVNIVSVGYRKTPEHQYPCALLDAYDMVNYLLIHNDFKFDRNKISVFGSSAGANLAAAVCIFAKQNGNQLFKYQFLNYPFIDLSTDPASMGHPNDQLAMYYLFNELYVDTEKARCITVSPIWADIEELKNLPQALIITAENDALSKSGKYYAERLTKAGNFVEYYNAPDMMHGFFEFAYPNESQAFKPNEVAEGLSNGKIERERIQVIKRMKKYFN